MKISLVSNIFDENPAEITKMIHIENNNGEVIIFDPCNAARLILIGNLYCINEHNKKRIKELV